MNIKNGQKAYATKKFDERYVNLFAELTGDYNPIHFNSDYAEMTIFKRPIVHGPLVLTLITTLFANELPGPGSIYLSHTIRFIKPVFYNDEITAILEVIDINAKGHIFINAMCKNQFDEVVIDGIARLKKIDDI